jgi:hypothetical protein
LPGRHYIHVRSSPCPEYLICEVGNGNDGVGSLYLDARRTHSWYSRPSLLSRAPVVTNVISGLVVSGGRSWKRRCHHAS